jgi:hypothetical protein
MPAGKLRRRIRRARRNTRRWDGFSVGIIAILAGITLLLVAVAMQHG